MNRNRWIEAVKKQMPKVRWEHTQRVMDTAQVLSKRFRADEEKAKTAALLHDYCKYWQKERMEKVIREQGLARDLLEHPPVLWHAPVGAEVVRRELGIKDKEILDAICYHTSGRPHMSLLEKIIFIADYIEPGRSFPGVEEVRQLAEQDLDRAVLKSLDNTLIFLIQKQQKVYPLTLAARNYMLDQVNQTQSKEESI